MTTPPWCREKVMVYYIIIIIIIIIITCIIVVYSSKIENRFIRKVNPLNKANQKIHKPLTIYVHEFRFRPMVGADEAK